MTNWRKKLFTKTGKYPKIKIKMRGRRDAALDAARDDAAVPCPCALGHTVEGTA